MPEPWTEIRVEVPAGWQELVAETLARDTGGGSVIGQATIGTRPPAEGRELVRSYLCARDDTPERRARVARTLAALAESTGAVAPADLAPTFRVLPPEDYAESWRKAWRPFRAGRIAVLPPWSPEPRRADDRVLVLEPGAVFGSGRHATTRTCLRLLQSRVADGDRVIDAGTGSGILSVVSTLLGAAEAFGFDVDAQSEPAASELARTNGVAGRCRFQTGGFELLPRAADRDGVIANIYHDVLESEAAALAQTLRPGGWFVASGCSLPHRDAVAAAFAAAGLAVDEERTRGRWVSFAGRRRVPTPRSEPSTTPPER